MNIVWGVVEQLICEIRFVLEQGVEIEAVLYPASSPFLFYWPVASGNSTYMD